MSGGSQASLSPEKITGVINYWWVTSECGTFCKMGEIVTGDVLMFHKFSNGCMSNVLWCHKLVCVIN